MNLPPLSCRFAHEVPDWRFANRSACNSVCIDGFGGSGKSTELAQVHGGTTQGAARLAGAVGAAITPFDHALSDRTDAEDLATLVRLVATQRLHPIVGVTAPFEQTAQSSTGSGDVRCWGNAVLRVVSGAQASTVPSPRPR
jgi:hypothetical protein